MKKIFSILISCISLFGCTNHSAKIADEKDFSNLLETAQLNQHLELLKMDMNFWNSRLQKNNSDLGAQVKMASLYNKLFQYIGNINDVHKSDSLYHAANKLQKHFGSGIYRSLAANCVTQHQFKQADLYLDTAAAMGDDRSLTSLQQFDVKLELGQYNQAEKILNSFRYKNTFEYYIRLSKLQDHKGNAEESIRMMEKALAEMESAKNDHLILWAKTNLADMYGHHNRVEDAYRLYVNVIHADPNYYQAWKGIAWIAFSHDRNTAIAKKILGWLKANHPVPDYDLLLAEIASFENDLSGKNNYITSFINEVSKPVYGDMYNKYLFALLTDEQQNFSAAMRIAETEVNNRPTPQSYDLLAWANYKTGNFSEAGQIARAQVIKRTFEPTASFHIGLILKSTGNKKMARQYLLNALESSFELGPLVTNEIKRELKTL